MANFHGTFSGGSGSANYWLWLDGMIEMSNGYEEVTENNTTVIKPYSIINCDDMRVAKNAGSGYYTSTKYPAKYYINGVLKAENSCSFDFPSNPSITLIATRQDKIYRSTWSATTATVSGTFNTSSSTLGNGSVSGDIALTAITPPVPTGISISVTDKGVSEMYISATGQGVVENPTYQYAISSSNDSSNLTWEDPNFGTLMHWDNLSHNTTYYVFARVKNVSSDWCTSTGYAVTTAGNPPTIATPNFTIGRDTFTLNTLSITYDTNASLGSKSLKYFKGLPTSTNQFDFYENVAVTGLTPNTTYNYDITITDNFGYSSAIHSSLKTIGNAPVVSNFSVVPSRTSCQFNCSITYDTNDAFSSYELKYGTTSSYGNTVNGTEITNLSPNTTYYYSFKVIGTQGRSSEARTGTFKTTCNAPTINSFVVSSTAENSITLSYSATGDTNAPITKYELSYKLYTGTSYTYIDAGTNTTTTITGLTADSAYQIRMRAINDGGSTWYNNGGTITTNTIMASINVADPVITHFKSYKATQTSITTINPSRPLLFYFCKNTPWVMHNRNLFNMSRWYEYRTELYRSPSNLSYSMTSNGISIGEEGYINNYQYKNNSYTTQNMLSKFGIWSPTGNSYTMAFERSTGTTAMKMIAKIYDAGDFSLQDTQELSLGTNETGRVTKTFTTSSSVGNFVLIAFEFVSEFTTNSSANFDKVYFGIDSTGTYVDYAIDTYEYQWRDITPSTTYNFKTRVFANTNTLGNSYKTATSNTVTATSPAELADQSVINFKKNGSWITGKGWYKTDGDWEKIAYVYIKVNGEWKKQVSGNE